MCLPSCQAWFFLSSLLYAEGLSGRSKAKEPRWGKFLPAGSLAWNKHREVAGNSRVSVLYWTYKTQLEKKKEVSHEFATKAINPLHSSDIHLTVTACWRGIEKHPWTELCGTAQLFSWGSYRCIAQALSIWNHCHNVHSLKWYCL